MKGVFAFLAFNVTALGKSLLRPYEMIEIDVILIQKGFIIKHLSTEGFLKETEKIGPKEKLYEEGTWRKI